MIRANRFARIALRIARATKGLTKVMFVSNISDTATPSLPPTPKENTDIYTTLCDTILHDYVRKYATARDHLRFKNRGLFACQNGDFTSVFSPLGHRLLRDKLALKRPFSKPYLNWIGSVFRLSVLKVCYANISSKKSTRRYSAQRILGSVEMLYVRPFPVFWREKRPQT